MRDLLLKLISEYLMLFPNEKERQERFIEYLKNHTDEQITDWNNFDGHVVVGGFIYVKEEQKFLVIYHNDLKMFLYPGGHVDSGDVNPLEASRREVFEETGFDDIEEVVLSDNKLIPIDIDTHVIPYNERLDLPEHYHFEFRYLFAIDSIKEVKLDLSESSKFKWISIEELREDKNYGRITEKIDSDLALIRKQLG
ncbi:MAG: NUDIX domain-containing protein [Bacilli bacterium]|nr:NUDIX domain-containing protein [Bacilli bacterium]